ncbi:unnamed protein product [Paramecium sonneborni]|uniref:Protein kinase domain-containing protein n=1 Tax=Paramecium sonneborni TaxID=65129 RepID=A0A8S1RL80_9CILI|nr:unnamed protein product [Paramecium sonneborni]
MFSEKLAFYVMKQIMSSILYEHNQSIVHKDLKQSINQLYRIHILLLYINKINQFSVKPENFLLDITKQSNSNVKVVD